MKKMNYNYNNINIGATDNTLFMYNRENNNGFISAIVDDVKNRIEFTVYSDNYLSSFSKFLISDYVSEMDCFWDTEDLYAITLNSMDYIHP